MTWSLETSRGNESAKIRWELVPYTRGRGLDVGCGPVKAFDHFIGVDNGHHEMFGQRIKPDIRVDTAEKLDVFASGSMDFVYSSHLLEHIPFAAVPKTLREWWRVLKHGGYLVLYVPDEDEYPKCREPERGIEEFERGCNPDHKWNVNRDRVIEVMRQVGSWDLVDFQKRNGGNEYSLFFVFKKVGKGQHFSHAKERPPMTAAVIRYGAFGDLIQASSVFAGLKKQGYHVTLYTSPPGCDVITHDPHIDAVILQDKDQVPNHCLGEFWAAVAKKYDRFVNLSESVEGSMLAMPGRTIHAWPPAVRHSAMNRNYLELQHELAGVPHEPAVRFYPTGEEREWAIKERRKIAGPVIVWSLSGSSVHKTWPYLDHIIAAIMLDFPTAHVVLVGGPDGKILEAGWEKEKRVLRTCGDWSIRQSMAFLEQADLVVGPETGVLNAAAQLPVWKVVFLSHSTVENLTRDWINTVSLYSKETRCPGRGNNDAPACHQLHYGWAHCQEAPLPADQQKEPGRAGMGVAQCQADITPDQAYEPIWTILKDLLSKAA